MPYTIINFYPRPPRGGRPVSVPVRYSSFLNFYPRPPRGGRRGMRRGSPDLRNFYPRPPRGGRRRQPVQWPRRFSISIHALREEGDLPLGRNETARKISIHALREEGDVREDSQRRKDRNFYPRPPRGGRRLHAPSFRRCYRISIHALREEGDLRRQHPVPSHMRFLSTPSARRATVSVSSGSSRVSNFYPRPPRGGRRVSCQNADKPTIFLSTPSARRATLCRHSVPPVWSISIHALREEGDGGGFFVYRMVL